MHTSFNKQLKSSTGTLKPRLSGRVGTGLNGPDDRSVLFHTMLSRNKLKFTVKNVIKVECQKGGRSSQG